MIVMNETSVVARLQNYSGLSQSLLRSGLCHLPASLHCTLSLAAQCIVIGPVCVQLAGGRCVFVALVCYHARELEISYIDLYQTGSVLHCVSKKSM